MYILFGLCLRNLHKAQKQISKPELKMLEYVDELRIEHIITKRQDGQIDGTPDTIIQTIDTHAIALFEDGCWIHGCLEHYPVDEGKHSDYQFQSEKREYEIYPIQNLYAELFGSKMLLCNFFFFIGIETTLLFFKVIVRTSFSGFWTA